MATSIYPRRQSHLWSTGSNLGGFTVLRSLEERVELADKQVLGAREVVPGCDAEGQIRILHGTCDVRNQVVLFNAHRQNLQWTNSSVMNKLTDTEYWNYLFFASSIYSFIYRQTFITVTKSCQLTQCSVGHSLVPDEFNVIPFSKYIFIKCKTM